MLHYEKLGNGKKNLVLLHGFLENTTIWKGMESFLIDNFTLYKIDLPGHGKSKEVTEICTMEYMAERVNETLECIGISNYYLVGHSMGGYVALEIAYNYPFKLDGLCLFFSSFLEDDEKKKEMRRKSFRIMEEHFSHFVEAGVPDLFHNKNLEKTQEQIKTAVAIANSTNPQAAIAATKGMLARTCKKEFLESFDTKTIHIIGKYDNAISMKNLLNNFPENDFCNYYILPCGHCGHWESPSVCAAILLQEFA